MHLTCRDIKWTLRGGPNSCNTAKAFFVKDLGHAKALIIHVRPAQSSLMEMADTRMFMTKENNNGLRGSLC